MKDEEQKKKSLSQIIKESIESNAQLLQKAKASTIPQPAN